MDRETKYKLSNSWNKSYENKVFNEFLFTTGDRSSWVAISKKDLENLKSNCENTSDHLGSTPESANISSSHNTYYVCDQTNQIPYPAVILENRTAG